MRRAPLSAGLIVYCAASLLAQTSDTRPRFDVTSVKRNLSGCAQGRGGGGAPQPGRLSVTCITVKDLIQAAYGTFANGLAGGRQYRFSMDTDNVASTLAPEPGSMPLLGTGLLSIGVLLRRVRHTH